MQAERLGWRSSISATSAGMRGATERADGLVTGRPAPSRRPPQLFLLFFLPLYLHDKNIRLRFAVLNLIRGTRPPDDHPAIFVPIDKRILTVEVLGSGDAPRPCE